MKIKFEEFLIKSGEFGQSEEFIQIFKEIHTGIQCVSWNDPQKFIINPIKHGNGVFPIKNNFISYLKSQSWQTERKMTLALGMNPGPIDAIKSVAAGLFAVEWETGNISSSHRALNKIAVGILQKQIIGGILILPTRNFSRYLTDRVGNYEEILPYFLLFRSINILNGVIGIIGIEHDDTDSTAPMISKRNDGNAKKPGN